jgi:hypothetical protein
MTKVPWRKIDGNLDGDLYHCIWDSNLVDDIQNDTENKETAAELSTTSWADASQEEAIFESINNHFKQNKLNQAPFAPIQEATEDDEPVTQDTIGRECEIYVALRHLRYSCPRFKAVFPVQIIIPRFCGILWGILMRFDI